MCSPIVNVVSTCTLIRSEFIKQVTHHTLMLVPTGAADAAAVASDGTIL